MRASPPATVDGDRHQYRGQRARRGIIAALGGLSLALLAGHPAAANPLKSLYTTIELDTCTKLAAAPDRSAWLCPGLPGYPVYVATGNRRTYVSVGAEPEKRKAARQTLQAPNTLFGKPSNRATLEWRFVKRDGKVLPYATIQRYFTRHEGRAGEVLVVTRVTPTEDCHVAHIDALANPDAIAMARTVADRDARAFACQSSPRQVGVTGNSPM